jgi:hypothetical protein
LRIKFLAILFLIPLSFACSSSDYLHVQGMDIVTSTEEQRSIIEWEGIVSLGNLRLPESVLPILSPDRTSLGELTFQKLDDGTDRISIKLDQSLAQKYFSIKSPTLPNGSTIVINGKPAIQSLEIPLLQNSRLYLGSDPNGQTFAGIAINLPAFDRILSRYAKAEVVDSVDFEFSSISGSVGIYGSNTPGFNGVFLLANKSNMLSWSGTDRSPASLGKAFSRIFKKPVFASSDSSTSLNLVSQFRLNYLLSRNATVRIK